MLGSDVKNLCVYKSRYVDVITCNIRDGISDVEEMQENKCALNHQDCEELLKSKALCIETLRVQGDIREEILNVEYLHLNVQPFRNLKKLIFYRMAVTDEELKVIGRNLRQLRSLQLIKCFCEHFHDIIPGVNINTDNICNMVQLQELVIQPEKPPGTVRELKIQYINQLLRSLMKLTHLDLQNFTIVCEERAKYLLTTACHLEVLNIGLISSEFWCTFSGFLKCCADLRELTIQADEGNHVLINIKIVDILIKYCKNLRILKLENCKIDVKDLGVLAGLQELALSSCLGLTFNNLQQILGGLKLSTFKLINSNCVFDNTNYIYISQTLESITIDTIHDMEISSMFQRSLNHFHGLQTLNWLSRSTNHNWIAEKCPELQHLSLTNPFHLSRVFLKIKSLTELTLHSCTGLSWNLLNMIIFKLSLKRFKICTSNGLVDDGGNMQSLSTMQTTLEFITIPCEIFLVDLKHWLKLLRANQQLGLMLYGKGEIILSVRLICLLLAVDCIRQRYKRIKICGYQLELEDFQSNTILREIARLHINTNHYKAAKRLFTLEL